MMIALLLPIIMSKFVAFILTSLPSYQHFFPHILIYATKHASSRITSQEIYYQTQQASIKAQLSVLNLP